MIPSPGQEYEIKKMPAGSKSCRHLKYIDLCKFSDFKNESFCIIPSKTWICDGFSVNAFANLLAAFFDVALDHDALYEVLDIGINAAGVEYLFYDPDLLLELLAGVVVVGVYYGGGIDDLSLLIELKKEI